MKKKNYSKDGVLLENKANWNGYKLIFNSKPVNNEIFFTFDERRFTMETLKKNFVLIYLTRGTSIIWIKNLIFAQFLVIKILTK